jgi:hypothetical protein
VGCGRGDDPFDGDLLDLHAECGPLLEALYHIGQR